MNLIEKLSAPRCVGTGIFIVDSFPHFGALCKVKDEIRSRINCRDVDECMLFWKHLEAWHIDLIKVFSIVKVRMDWPIPAFIPEDDFGAVFFDGPDEFASFNAFRSIHSIYSFPLDSIIELKNSTFGEFVNRLFVKNVQ